MIVIRRAVPSDAAGIAHVQVESWRTTYRGIVPDEHLESLDETARTEVWKSLAEKTDLFVAERDGQIVGFVNGGAVREPVEDCDAELYAIYLLLSAQRSRIGTDLLRELVHSLMQKGFRSMSVLVLEKNPSRQFYIRTGAHYAGSMKIEISGAVLNEEVYVWPDLSRIQFPAPNVEGPASV